MDLDIEITSEKDILNLSIPSDWNVKEVEVLDNSLKALWEKDDGSSVSISPFPYPNQTMHNIRYSENKLLNRNISGRLEPVEYALELIRRYSDIIDSFNVDYFSKLYGCKNIDINGWTECRVCFEDALILDVTYSNFKTTLLYCAQCNPEDIDIQDYEIW